MSDYLFAYGFLKRVYHGNTQTKTPPMDVEFVCPGLYQGRIYRIMHYPGVIFDENEGYVVHGEVFKMKNAEQLLPVLDRYEHALPLIKDNPEYQRVLRTIKTPNGPIECWVYEYLKSLKEENRIPGGVF